MIFTENELDKAHKASDNGQEALIKTRCEVCDKRMTTPYAYYMSGKSIKCIKHSSDKEA